MQQQYLLKMNIDSYNNLYIICIEASLANLYEFVMKDNTLKSFHKEMSYINISEFYKNMFYKKSEKDFYGAIFFTSPNLENKTIVLGNAGSWATLCNYISKELKIRNIQFDIGTNRNTLFVNQSGILIRSVQTLLDDNCKWLFFSRGDILDFENPLYYKKKIIKERLNKDILVEYCYKNDLNVRDFSFFSSDKKCMFIRRNILKR